MTKAGTYTDIDLARICGVDEMTNTEERIEKIVFNDFSKFDNNRCSDGGNYWFKTVWVRTDVDQWAVSYDTSCTAFAFCEACGNFYQGSHCGCGEHRTILTTAELAEELKKYKGCETEDDWFTVHTNLNPLKGDIDNMENKLTVEDKINKTLEYCEYTKQLATNAGNEVRYLVEIENTESERIGYCIDNGKFLRRTICQAVLDARHYCLIYNCLSSVKVYIKTYNSECKLINVDPIDEYEIYFENGIEV